MSAAQWRKAMNSGAERWGSPSAHRPPTNASSPVGGSERSELHRSADTPLRWLHDNIAPHHIVVAVALLVFPFVASPFITFQVAGQSLALGLVALSMMFLSGYGGMVSLAQMTIAGMAGYTVAILGGSASAISLGWPWPVVLLVAMLVATLAATLIGWLSVRTEGIYTIMITLAVGVAFYYLALQNYTLFNGFQGFQKVYPPNVLGIDWRSPLPFYFLALACSLAGYLAVKYLARAPFGIALQGIRDNPRRMNALGYNVTAHRVAAYAFAGLLAATGGVLFTWYNGLVTPGSVGTSWLINILVIAVLGGMRHPVGPFLGAFVFVLLQTFAIDLIERERFNLLIGAVFLAIVLFSPDGLLGLWAAAKARLRKPATVPSTLR